VKREPMRFFLDSKAKKSEKIIIKGELNKLTAQKVKESNTVSIDCNLINKYLNDV
tara:strand:+ start:2302 stop:2466 length:165 start_codon:yes stop_codon:yes gene_type:complete